MLDERKAAILRAVVESHIRTAQPVSSSYVAQLGDLGRLAGDGAQRDGGARAGRISFPAARERRPGADRQGLPVLRRLALPGRPRWRAQSELVRMFFARTHGELERMLAETSGLLSRLTDYAAVVVAPSAPEPGRVRSLQLVKVSTQLVLVVAVLSQRGRRAAPARAVGRGLRRPGRRARQPRPRCPW